MKHNQQTYLVFPTLYNLWQFAQAINVRSMEINTARRLLICPCKEADVTLAKEAYGASLLSHKEFLNMQDQVTSIAE